jgi:membrane-associated protease RseP (regulator of RpoE activity)
MRLVRPTAAGLATIVLAGVLSSQDAPSTRPSTDTRSAASPASETRAASRPAEARARHPRMGIRCETVTLEQQKIARVEAVLGGSPAERGGIRVGDVIVKVGGEEIRDDKTYRDVMSRRRPGESVDVVVRRGGEELDLVVTLPDKPTRTEPESVVVQHCLIGCEKQAPTPAGKARAVEQARKLADEIAMKAKNGAEFGELVKSYSEDQGSVAKTPPGSYTMVQDGKPKPVPDAREKSGMVASFSAVAFALEVGDVAIAAYDPTLSPYGFHVIKRIR